jgi:hypothetical protein
MLSPALAGPVKSVDPSAASRQAVPQSKKLPVQDPRNTPPMTFYIAKGEPDSCGTGCSEWIVGEGRFVFGTTDRFRAALRQAGNRKLPVFFNSPGGEVRAAISLGRMMRQRGMTAGVGKTVPAGCAGMQTEVCDKLKVKSDAPLQAQFSGYGGQCNSACVYALIGAKTREVPPTAVIGVHAVHLTLQVKILRGPKLSQAKLNAMAKSRLDDVNENLRDYIAEMGIAPELYEIASGVSPNSLRVLTRDEIARLGIDARKTVESPWSIVGGTRPVLMKTIAEAKNTPGRKYRSSMIVFTCDSGAGRTLIHGRELDGGDGGGLLVNAAYGANNLAFPATGRTMKVGELFYMTRSARVPRNFFQTEDANASFDILETAGGAGPRVERKYPARDLNRSLDDLEQSCARSTSARAQAQLQP